MATKSKSVIPQLSMYPKDMVYPPGGGDIQLEMIRAERPIYKQRFIFTEQEDDGVCDMEMTEACLGHITLNIPVMTAVEKGKRVNVMMQQEKGQVLSRRVPQKVNHEEVDKELFKLCQDKENLLSAQTQARKETMRKKEERKALDIEWEFQQLMQERDCEQYTGHERQSEEGEGLVGVDQLNDKENKVPKQTKPLFQFTPSGNDENSLASWHGNSLTGTQLNFSEADSTSLSVSNNDRSTQGRGQSKLHAVLDCEQKAHPTKEQQMFEAQFINGSVSNNDRSTQGRGQSKLHAVLDCEQKAHLTKEQQMFEAQFINGYTEMEVKSENVDYGSCSIGGATTQSSFSVFEDQSSLNLHVMGVSQEVPESFSVFEDPSQLSVSERSRVNQNRQQNSRTAPSGSIIESFSVYEDPSQQSITVATDPSISSSRKTLSEGSSRTDGPKVVDKRTLSTPESEPEPPGFTEFELPSRYEPTSTPTGKRIGLDMSVELTMIYLKDDSMLKKPCEDKLSNPAPCLLPPPPPLPSLSIPSVSVSTDVSHIPFSLETIQEESRSNYTSSTSGSSNSYASKLTNLSRSSIMSTGHHYTEDEIITGLKESGVMNSLGYVKAFAAKTTEFMCQSVPVTNTPMYEVPSPSPRLISGNNVNIAGLKYTVLKKLAKGGFATVFLVANAQRPMESRKVLKVQSPCFLWEVVVVEELHKRLKANDLTDMSVCFMRIDSVSLFSDASLTMYDYFHHGTLLDLVNCCSTGPKIPEPIIVFYALELVRIVDALHKCGIIHADLKPDNVILRDIRPCKDVFSVQGRGLCLIDFGRAIDVQAFPRGTAFIGSNKTDGFQCAQMIDNTTWTYQADLHCIAGTVHVMMFAKYMELSRDSTGLYKPNSTVSRLHDRNVWNQFYLSLLNWNSDGGSNDPSHQTRPDLIGMAGPLFDKLQNKMFNKTFLGGFNSLWCRLTK